MKILKAIRKKRSVFKAGLAALAIIFLLEDTVYAATNKSGCESKGTVSAVYDTAGTGANGYYKKNGKVIVTYNMGKPVESCSDTTYQYVGITNKVEVPQIDASGTNVSGGGHVCNGHTSNSAEWKHWFGLSGSVLYGMSTKNEGSVTVTEEEYKKCSYAIAGPSTSVGDGLGSNGKFYWIVLYKKLPSVIEAANIDMTAPAVELNAAPAGRTAVNPANGRTYGTQAVLTAAATDQESRPHKTKTFRFKNASGNITDWIAANSGNKKAATSAHTVNANGSYFVEAQDQLENSSVSKGVSVDFIDQTAPTAMLEKTVNEKIIAKGLEWTATTVTLKAVANDSGAGLSARPYCFDGVTWMGTSEYVISQNGMYKVKIQDALGNMVTKSIVVDNFDRQAPEGEVSTNYKNSITIGEKIWSRDEAVVEIQAEDEGCGLDERPYSFDGGKSWIAESSHAFSQNGNYEIKVRDGLHNAKSVSVKLEGIDKTAPIIEEIKMEPETWKTGDATVKINARDNEDGCGLAKAAYSFDGGKTWTEKNEIVLKNSADLEILVRDQLGNSANQDFHARCTPDEKKKDGDEKDEDKKKDDKDDEDKKKKDDKDGDGGKKKKGDKDGDKDKKKKNEIEGEGKKKDKNIKEKTKNEQAETVPEEGNIIPEKKYVEGEKKKKSTKDTKAIPKNSNTTPKSNQKEKTKQEAVTEKTYQVPLPVLEEEKEQIEIQEYDTNDTKKETTEKTFLEKVCVSALIAILLLGLLGLLLWYLFVFCKYKAVLYGREDGRYKRLGTVAISQKNEQHAVDIPDELLQQISGNYYRLKVNPAYLLEQEGEDIYIHIEERMLKKQVEKYIDFYVS